jgi:hypothetical protein
VALRRFRAASVRVHGRIRRRPAPRHRRRLRPRRVGGCACSGHGDVRGIAAGHGSRRHDRDGRRLRRHARPARRHGGLTRRGRRRGLHGRHDRREPGRDHDDGPRAPGHPCRERPQRLRRSARAPSAATGGRSAGVHRSTGPCRRPGRAGGARRSGARGGAGCCDTDCVRGGRSGRCAVCRGRTRGRRGAIRTRGDVRGSGSCGSRCRRRFRAGDPNLGAVGRLAYGAARGGGAVAGTGAHASDAGGDDGGAGWRGCVVSGRAGSGGFETTGR